MLCRSLLLCIVVLTGFARLCDAQDASGKEKIEETVEGLFDSARDAYNKLVGDDDKGDAPVSSKLEEQVADLYENVKDKYNDIAGDGTHLASSFTSFAAASGDLEDIMEDKVSGLFEAGRDKYYGLAEHEKFLSSAVASFVMTNIALGAAIKFFKLGLVLYAL